MQEMVRNLFVAFWPEGGQGRARRNAWSAMVVDTKRARDRAAADAVMAAAAHKTEPAPLAVGH
jgi:hypothetical protein